MKKYYVLLSVLVILTVVYAQGVKYIVDPKMCIGCTICVVKCPVKAIEMKDNKAVIDVNKCIGCGICSSVCPVKAISIRKSVEPVKSVPDSTALKVPEPKAALPDSTKKAIPDSLKKEVKPKTPESEKKDDSELITPLKAEPSIIQPVVIVKTVYKVDESSCIGCQICISKCPVNAIEFKKNSAVIDPKKCIGCGLCAAACPVKAIAKV